MLDHLVGAQEMAPPWRRVRHALSDEVVRTGRLEVDAGSLCVWVAGVPVRPSANELRLLVALAVRLGRAVLYGDLVRMLWWQQYDPAVNADRLANEHLLRVTTSRLRRRLGDGAAGLIVTIPNIGLRLERVPIGDAGPAPRSAAHPGRPRLQGWSRLHARCVACGTTARRHWAHGLCLGCRPRDRASRWQLLRARKDGTG